MIYMIIKTQTMGPIESPPRYNRSYEIFPRRNISMEILPWKRRITSIHNYISGGISDPLKFYSNHRTQFKKSLT